jgi:hypothetical protein
MARLDRATHRERVHISKGFFHVRDARSMGGPIKSGHDNYI